MGYFSKSHWSDNIIANLSNILSYSSFDWSRSISNIKGFSILLISAWFWVIKGWMHPTWNSPAAWWVNPEVWWSSVWDNCEFLRRSSNFNINEILSIHEISYCNMFTVKSVKEFIVKIVYLSLNHIFCKILLMNFNFTGWWKTEKGCNNWSFLHF